MTAPLSVHPRSAALFNPSPHPPRLSPTSTLRQTASLYIHHDGSTTNDKQPPTNKQTAHPSMPLTATCRGPSMLLLCCCLAAAMLWFVMSIHSCVSLRRGPWGRTEASQLSSAHTHTHTHRERERESMQRIEVLCFLCLCTSTMTLTKSSTTSLVRA